MGKWQLDVRLVAQAPPTRTTFPALTLVQTSHAGFTEREPALDGGNTLRGRPELVTLGVLREDVTVFRETVGISHCRSP